MLQAVLSMVRNPSRTPLGDFYTRKQREKGSGKAICATARKLLALILVLLTNDLDYWFLEERLYQRKLRLLARAAAGHGRARPCSPLDSSWEWQTGRRYFSTGSIAKLTPEQEVPPLPLLATH